MEGARTVSKWVVIVGALNWGLVGLLNYDLVEGLFGSLPMLVRFVYLMVGVAGLWGAYSMLTKKK